jgi:DNA-binding LacI/PurR family transcriptional regulator
VSNVLNAPERVSDATRQATEAAIERLGYRSIAIANRVQAWTVGARWALEHEWDGRAPYA